MPLWHIYHHPSAFSAEDKKELSKRITAYYHETPTANLPKFYVVVTFCPLEDIFVGGEEDKNFVRIFVHHLAKHPSPEDEARTHRTMAGFDNALKPFIEDRGMNWEYSYFNSPRQFWKINGIIPPPTDSEAETKWRNENKPTPY